MTLKVGDRVRLVEMRDDSDPIAPGSLGTVDYVSEHEIGVAWDNGRTLSLIPGVDRWDVAKYANGDPDGPCPGTPVYK